MASLKDVHQLIHSLEKREKIFFNMHANALGGKAKDNYVNDYQCFAKQKVYNKEKLKLALNKVKKRKSLSESNTNLYNFILDSMLGIYKNKQKNIGFLNQIQNVEILFQKGLIEQSSQVFYKLKQKIIAAENQDLLFYLQGFENKLLLHQSKSHTNYDKRIELIDERLAFVNGVEVKLKFRKLKRQLFDLAGKIGTPRDQKSLDQYLELQNSEALTMNASLLPKSSYADYYIVKFMLQICIEPKNSLKGITILQEGLQLIEEEIDIKQNFVPAFLVSRMIMKTAVLGKDEKVALDSIKAFENIKEHITTNYYNTLAKTVLYSSYLLYYLNFNKLNEAYSYLLENKTFIIDKENLALSPHFYTNYLTCARICFLKEDFSLSLEFVELLLDMKGKIRKSILPPVYGLFLLNHYKMENKVYLPYAIRSLYRSILKAGQLYEPEKALLSFFRKAANTLDIKSELQKLYDKLNEIKDDPFHTSFFGNADYLTWLKNEINQKASVK